MPFRYFYYFRLHTIPCKRINILRNNSQTDKSKQNESISFVIDDCDWTIEEKETIIYCSSGLYMSYFNISTCLIATCWNIRLQMWIPKQMRDSHTHAILLLSICLILWNFGCTNSCIVEIWFYSGYFSFLLSFPLPSSLSSSLIWTIIENSILDFSSLKWITWKNNFSS